MPKVKTRSKIVISLLASPVFLSSFRQGKRMQEILMARDAALRQVQAFQWQQQQHPEEPEERDIAVDPFSLRQFSRLNIDRPLPIPSVSVADPHVPSSSSPAPFFASGSASVAVSAPLSSSPRGSIAGRLNNRAEATGWDDDARSASPAATQQQEQMPSAALPRVRRKSSTGGGETTTTELADANGFNVLLSSSGRKPLIEPQRWESDVPLIAAAEDEEEGSAGGYSFPNDARGSKSGRRRGKAKDAAGGEAPFSCCMYVPGLHRRGKPPTPTPTGALPLSSSSFASGAFTHAAAAIAEKQQYTDDPVTALQSVVSLAVSLERFDCGSLSTSSWGDLDPDDGEVVASSSSYFDDDLPLELVLGCDDDDTDLPVCAAFVFDGDVIRKTVLKKRPADTDGGVGEAPRRPSLGRVSSSRDASGRFSAAHVRVSLKSRPPSAPTSP